MFWSVLKCVDLSILSLDSWAECFNSFGIQHGEQNEQISILFCIQNEVMRYSIHNSILNKTKNPSEDVQDHCKVQSDKISVSMRQSQ